MRSISSALHTARHILSQDKGWLLFVEVASVAGGAFRLVQNTRNLAANGLVWQATELAIAIPDEESDVSLGDLSIAVPNVSRLAVAYLENGDIIGQKATAWLAHEGSLASFSQALSWTHTVKAARVTETVATFICGHPASLLRVPGPVYDRGRFRQLVPAKGGVAS